MGMPSHYPSKKVLKGGLPGPHLFPSPQNLLPPSFWYSPCGMRHILAFTQGDFKNDYSIQALGYRAILLFSGYDEVRASKNPKKDDSFG